MKTRTEQAAELEVERLLRRYAVNSRVGAPDELPEVVDRALRGRSNRVKGLREQLEVAVITRENAEASRLARMLVALAELELQEGDDGE